MIVRSIAALLLAVATLLAWSGFAAAEIDGDRYRSKPWKVRMSAPKGGQVIRDELQRVVPPLLKDGGFIPGCDHGVPHDISWPNFIDYTRLLAELTGWL